MNEYPVKILKIESLTHDVKRFVVEKPKGYSYLPGQFTIFYIPLPEWKNQKRTFTIASSPDSDYLEFDIKRYTPEGFTSKLHSLKTGDKLKISSPLGRNFYTGEGIMIAAGSGITPFLSLFRHLKNKDKVGNNFLIWSNKTEKDFFLTKEIKEILGENFLFTTTRGKKKGFESGRIDLDFLKKHIKNFDKIFYVCGSMEFIIQTRNTLMKLGVKPERIIKG